MLADGGINAGSFFWYATLPLWPLLGAIVVGLMLAFNVARARAHWPVILGAAVAAFLAVLLASELNGLPGGPAAEHKHVAAEEVESAASAGMPAQIFTIGHWISLGGARSAQHQWIDLNFFFDGLTGVMMVVVCVVGLLVICYANGYMRDHHGHQERGFERFFAFLGLFVFSMCMLVLAGNFVLLYLGWELVGLCSYLLIGFFYERPSAAAAAKKAFIVNRIGDFGFALGIFTLYYFMAMGPHPLAAAGENPLDYSVVFRHAHELSQMKAIWGLSATDAICLLLMCGALGKSAQFPLYVWLPDAMEGPTPVSALIHAATMVTAGVYMIARCGPLYSTSPLALNVVIAVGAIGTILAATMAMAQYDMKRILAYSTMSQLAYMFVALGVGAPDSGIFHLYTHAFFKALLFLTAGSVMHAMGNVIDLRQFSGLSKVLPQTRTLMLIGCLALAGFPLLAGFWSKDEIVHAAYEHSPALGGLLLLVAFMTAYYTFRMYFLCFSGPVRLPKEAGDHPHEAPLTMLAPLYVLAIGAVLAGYAGVHLGGGENAFLGLFSAHGFFHHYVGASSIVRTAAHAEGGSWLMYLSSVISLAGIGLAWLRYGKAPQSDPDAALLGPLWRMWHFKYWVDEAYDRIFVRPLRGLGVTFSTIDRAGIDGLIWLITAVPRGLSTVLRFFQLGALQGYALAMVAGVTLLLLIWRFAETGGTPG